MKFPINSFVGVGVDSIGYVVDYRTMNQYHWYLVQFATLDPTYRGRAVWILENNIRN